MKNVLLFSGGLDSYIIYRLLDIDLCLYCDIGSKYAAKEIENIQKLGIRNFHVDRRLNLTDQELANSIVPMRNLFFAMIGLYYGDHIILGATAGDTTRDKDYTFANLSSALLAYLFSDPKKNPKYWNEKCKVDIDIPFKKFTKTELVALYLSKGYHVGHLLQTRSCYEAQDKECGICRSCIRKWVALVNNGIDYENYFAIDPYQYVLNHADELLAKDRGKENDDLERALEKCKSRESLQ